MTATVPLSETPDHTPGWTLSVDGKPVPSRHWHVQSRFGAIGTAVVCDPSGKPVFDRPYVAESPNVNLVVYGYTPTRELRVAAISQPRPHADDPEQPGVDGHNPVVFGQIAMGFVKTVLGESIEEAGEREAAQETGASIVVSYERPNYPWHNPNPTFVKTWSDLLFIEVDLARVEALRPSRNEPIYKAEFISVPELLRRIRVGKNADGAVYRMCTANSAWMIFFACHPELFVS